MCKCRGLSRTMLLDKEICCINSQVCACCSKLPEIAFTTPFYMREGNLDIYVRFPDIMITSNRTFTLLLLQSYYNRLFDYIVCHGEWISKHVTPMYWTSNSKSLLWAFSLIAHSRSKWWLTHVLTCWRRICYSHVYTGVETRFLESACLCMRLCKR